MASASTINSRRGCSASSDHWAETDESHLARFLNGDEADSEEAFRELVRQHGPMVLGVCRHVLDQHSDAEDAFQATFLVLARNAGSIRDRRVLGRWLYEVAYRIAIRSRTRSAQRRSREKEGARMSAQVDRHEQDPAWNELRPVLHEEVNRLPEKYRTAVVLCYLEGRTNEEAASMLGWPVGTVKGRLSRARDLLRSRLTRRGLALSAAFIGLAFSKNEVFAEVVPSRLIDEATSSALAATRGGGLATLPARIRELVEDFAPVRSFWTVRAWWPTREQASIGALICIVIASSLFGLASVIAISGGPVAGSMPAAGLAAPLGVVVERDDNAKCQTGLSLDTVEIKTSAK